MKHTHEGGAAHVAKGAGGFMLQLGEILGAGVGKAGSLLPSGLGHINRKVPILPMLRIGP
jgi:hypothetical protein